MSDKKPNILFAVADDASHFSAYGHKFVNTPNFDRIASEGILFDNAFTPNPKCAPSRACILTGRQPWQLESACNHLSVFPSKFSVYPDILEENGYHVGFTGKGWAPGDFIAGGFTHNPAGNEYNSRTLTPPEGALISNCDYAGNFEDFLSGRTSNKPFCFWYGGYEPHRQYAPGEGVRAGKNPDDVEVPSYLPDTDSVRSDYCDYANEIDWFDMHLGRILKLLENTGEYDNTLIIVTSDNGCPFPRIKGQMYEQDLHLPMAACWKAFSPGGRTANDLISFIDLAPTFLDAAGIDVKGDMTGQSFLNLLKNTYQESPAPLRDAVYMGREKHDVGRKGEVGYPVRCIRTKEFLYTINLEPDRFPAGDPETWFPNCDGGPTKKEVFHKYADGDVRYYQLCFGRRPPEELFDMIKDPECLINLAAETEFDQIKSQLRDKLIMHLNETGDPRMTGDPDHFEHFPFLCDDSSSYKAYEEGRFKLQPW